MLKRGGKVFGRCKYHLYSLFSDPFIALDLWFSCLMLPSGVYTSQRLSRTHKRQEKHKSKTL